MTWKQHADLSSLQGKALRIVFALKNVLETRLNVRIGDDSKKNTSFPEEYQQEITKQLILETAREVKAKGSRFGILIIPSPKEVRVGDRQRTDKVVAICQNAGIPFLDLYPELSLDAYFVHDGHLNEIGHSIVAEEVIRFLATDLRIETLPIRP